MFVGGRYGSHDGKACAENSGSSALLWSTIYGTVLGLVQDSSTPRYLCKSHMSTTRVA